MLKNLFFAFRLYNFFFFFFVKSIKLYTASCLSTKCMYLKVVIFLNYSMWASKGRTRWHVYPLSKNQLYIIITNIGIENEFFFKIKFLSSFFFILIKRCDNILNSHTLYILGLESRYFLKKQLLQITILVSFLLIINQF